MVDRSKLTDDECIKSLADCLKIVNKLEDDLRIYKSVLKSSEYEFIRRFGKQ